MVFTTQCPQCGKILWFASNLTGKLTICPACGAVMKLTPPPEAAGPAEAVPEGTIPLMPEAAQAAPPLPPAAEQPPPMGSADGEVNQETGTPILGQEPVAEPAAEQIPAAVEEASLAHQAALAAAGEVHVEVNEGEMVEFSAQGEINAQMAPTQPSMAPPEWSPAPLSDYGACSRPRTRRWFGFRRRRRALIH